MSAVRRRKRRETTSRGVVICLIVTTLIIICSPPTVAVIRSGDAVANDEAVENDLSRAGARSPPHLGQVGHDRMEQAWLKQQHHRQQQQQFGTHGSSFLSSITDSLLDWRGGIFAEDRVDDHGQRPDDGAPSAASSASSRRKLRSRRPTKDRAQKKRPRGDRAGQEEHWCEFVQSLNASRSSLFLTHTLSHPLFALSISPTTTYIDADWSTNRCVQSCNPTPENPNCAGVALWDDIQFDTAEYCCSITFFWVSFEDCAGANSYEPTSSQADSDYDDDMTSLSSSSSSSGGGGMACPPEYSQFNGYRSRDTVTIYDSPSTGRVYQCKDDAMSLYCDQFPPDYARVAPGGGSVHTLELGWTLLGDCQGENPGSRGADSGGDSNGNGGSSSSTSGQLPFDGTFGGGEDDEPSCWRSGTLCDSQAGKFACCTYCRHGVCT